MSENLLFRYFSKVKKGTRAGIILGFLHIAFNISNAEGEELFIMGCSKQSNISLVEWKNFIYCSLALAPNTLCWAFCEKARCGCCNIATIFLLLRRLGIKCGAQKSGCV